MKLIWCCLCILVCLPPPSVARSFSSNQASVVRSFEARGMIVLLQSNAEEKQLCHVRYLQDQVWLILGAKGQSRQLLLPNAQYYDGSFACQPYQGNKDAGVMWRVQPYRYGIPPKNKLITVL